MKICFATNNAHKLEEIKQILGDRFQILSLEETGFKGEIPETHETIEENSLEKAQFVFDKIKIPIFSDDSGLEIEALDGRPGVHTAHYSGSRDAIANMDKVLGELQGIETRGARFKAVMTFINGNHQAQFEGIVNGKIAMEKTGEDGFGYDPIFIPQGYDTTFAQMSDELKNTMSHRKRAAEKLADFLNSLD